MINNVNYLSCVVMKFNENCKKDGKIVKSHKLTNFRPKLSLCHFVIDPVKSTDKFIDFKGLDKKVSHLHIHEY